MSTVGKQRLLLTLQEQTLTSDGGGGFSASWADVAEQPQIHVEIEALSGGEKFINRQIAFRATHRISMRYRADIDATMRLTDGPAIYGILSVLDPDGQQRSLSVIAEYRTA